MKWLDMKAHTFDLSMYYVVIKVLFADEQTYCCVRLSVHCLSADCGFPCSHFGLVRNHSLVSLSLALSAVIYIRAKHQHHSISSSEKVMLDVSEWGGMRNLSPYLGSFSILFIYIRQTPLKKL